MAHFSFAATPTPSPQLPPTLRMDPPSPRAPFASSPQQSHLVGSHAGRPHTAAAAPPGNCLRRDRERLVRFYTVHCPARLTDVDSVLSKYGALDGRLLSLLLHKYSTTREPTDADVAAARQHWQSGHRSPPRRQSQAGTLTSRNCELRQRIRRLLVVHEPSRLADVDELLAKASSQSQRGDESDDGAAALLLKLTAYGARPEPDDAAVALAEAKLAADDRADVANYWQRMAALPAHVTVAANNDPTGAPLMESAVYTVRLVDGSRQKGRCGRF